MLLIFTKYLSQPNIVLMLFKILVLVKYTGNTAHDIYRGWIYGWYFSRYFSSLIMLIILFKILFLANILTLYFKGYFYQPNVLPILFKILFSGECSLGASWCAATWRSLSAFCSKNLIEKRARPRSSGWEENKHLIMYQGPGCVSTWDIRKFKNILKAKGLGSECKARET